jgi:flagellar hook assembly protein FlgD
VIIQASGFNVNQITFINRSNGTGDSGTGQPDAFDLGHNFPNPFNNATTIPLTIPQDTDAEIIIYNQQGQVVKKIDARGQTEVTWDGLNQRNLSSGSGIYYYRLKAAQFMETKKMLLLR